MKKQTEEQKIQSLIDFINNPNKKILIYDILFEMFITYLPEGYVLKTDGSILLDGRKTNELILLIQRK